ncbi:MAG: hypothetical protein ABI675_17895 [Chitinophagaceae bacterium]
MAEENQEDPKQDPKQTPPPVVPPTPPIPINEGDQGVNSEGGGGTANNKGQAVFYTPQPFVVKVEQERKKGIDTKDILSFVALLVSIYAVMLNTCSLNNTTKALNITDSTFKVNIRKDSLAAISSARRDSLDRIKDEQTRIKDSLIIDLQNQSLVSTNSQNRKTLDMSKKSLQAQIESIKETQNQFEIQNMPYLQVGNFRYVNDSTLGYTLFNLNQYPAKIAAISLAIGVVGSINPLALQRQADGGGQNSPFVPVVDPLSVDVYVIKETPVERFFNPHSPISAYINEKAVRLYGRIWYKDVGTKKNRVYSFSVSLSRMNSKMEHKFHQNDNRTIEGEFPAFIYDYD